MNISDIYQVYKKCNFNISTDTRNLKKGSLFVALKGDKFDGNNFVLEALKKGAKYVISSRKFENKRVIYVKNTLKTLQELATFHRQKFKIPIIAIGGSNGKTTTKELLFECLSKRYKTHKTIASLNNHIGVPISILKMSLDTEIAVFEIGANHRREHTKLCKILKPNYVLVTNNGLDHLEGFGSPKEVRLGNKEIYDYARKNKCIVFVDRNIRDLMSDSEGCKRILYDTEKIKNTSKLIGFYNIKNIGASIFIAKYFSVSEKDCIKAISQYKPSFHRSESIKKKHNIIIADCYNANPTSMLVSLSDFIKISGKKFIIIGDMLEMGKYQSEMHRNILLFLKNKRVKNIILVGPLFKKANERVGVKAEIFDNVLDTSVWIKNNKKIFYNHRILLKASHGIGLEKLIPIL